MFASYCHGQLANIPGDMLPHMFFGAPFRIVAICYTLKPMLQMTATHNSLISSIWIWIWMVQPAQIWSRSHSHEEPFQAKSTVNQSIQNIPRGHSFFTSTDDSPAVTDIFISVAVFKLQLRCWILATLTLFPLFSFFALFIILSTPARV